VFRLDKIEDAGNAEFGGEFFGAHRSSFPSGTIIADRGTTSPSRNAASVGLSD
jgi:hypothetical protein